MISQINKDIFCLINETVVRSCGFGGAIFFLRQ